MAELAPPRLVFRRGCPDCGIREIELPPPLPNVGDDFDWRARDYDGLRLFILEELAARFPERTRWTPADLEVVLVEAVAAVLDQLSDMADRVAAEAFLETARRPASVYWLLRFIGFDAAQDAGLADDPEGPGARSAWDKLRLLWAGEPSRMEDARRAGPRAIHHQRRMANLADYAARLEDHPLVERAHAAVAWGGSWPVIRIAVILWEDRTLDDGAPERGRYPEDLRAETEAFHRRIGLPLPVWTSDPTIRTILRPYLEAYRMLGQEVVLEDAKAVGITMAISIRVRETYFQSEVRRAVDQALGRGPGGFFEPGRLRFGEDLHAGDVFQTLMAIDGVENVCLNRFKRIGRQYADQVKSGTITLDGLEIAVCDNDPNHPDRGYYTLTLHGGRRG